MKNAVKKIVLCFDRARDHPGLQDATNAEALLRLLDDGDDQIVWYHSGARDPGGRRLRWRGTAADDARDAIAEAYQFLIETWLPGDQLFVFGVGRGAYCAHALTRLLGTVGLLVDLKDYVISAYALPRTRRTPEDWSRVADLTAQLSGADQNAVPVAFLGLWDMVKVPGVHAESTGESLSNVASGRHAVAVDGGTGPFGEHLLGSEAIEEVWFRGAHCDVAGGPGACAKLAGIALDWMLDGAVRAGVEVRDDSAFEAPTPSDFDALAGSAPTMSVRKLPADALVHSSVEVYLREHPQYWRRLPAHVVWADMDWLARSERLVVSEAPSVPADSEALAAVAS